VCVYGNCMCGQSAVCKREVCAGVQVKAGWGVARPRPAQRRLAGNRTDHRPSNATVSSAWPRRLARTRFSSSLRQFQVATTFCGGDIGRQNAHCRWCRELQAVEVFRPPVRRPPVAQRRATPSVNIEQMFHRLFAQQQKSEGRQKGKGGVSVRCCYGE